MVIEIKKKFDDCKNQSPSSWSSTILKMVIRYTNTWYGLTRKILSIFLHDWYLRFFFLDQLSYLKRRSKNLINENGKIFFLLINLKKKKKRKFFHFRIFFLSFDKQKKKRDGKITKTKTTAMTTTNVCTGCRK